MKLTIRRSTCWLCNQSYNDSWLVTEPSGRLVYCTDDWNDAILYATERASLT